MSNSESRPSPGEDRHRGSHGGDGGRDRDREPLRSSQASGKDPGRRSKPEPTPRPPEGRVIGQPESGPPRHDLSPGAGPPGSERHARGWRADDPAADSVMPGREFGAGGGKVDGPAGPGGQATGARRDR